MKNREHEKLNKVMQKYLNRLMKGALDVVESVYGDGDEEKFKKVRGTILRLGNDQKRDAEEFLENYIAKESHTLLMEFKEELQKKGKE